MWCQWNGESVAEKKKVRSVKRTFYSVAAVDRMKGVAETFGVQR